MFRTRKAKKGLSGAVTALILVIASVIIALVVVGFAFGLFGAFGGTPTVTEENGVLFTNGTAILTLKSTGTVQVLSATIEGTPATVNTNSITGYSLAAGINTVTINFGSVSSLQPGGTYTITLTLSDGTQVVASVIAESPS